MLIELKLFGLWIIFRFKMLLFAISLGIAFIVDGLSKYEKRCLMATFFIEIILRAGEGHLNTLYTLPVLSEVFIFRFMIGVAIISFITVMKFIFSAKDYTQAYQSKTTFLLVCQISLSLTFVFVASFQIMFTEIIVIGLFHINALARIISKDSVRFECVRTKAEENSAPMLDWLNSNF